MKTLIEALVTLVNRLFDGAGRGGERTWLRSMRQYHQIPTHSKCRSTSKTPDDSQCRQLSVLLSPTFAFKKQLAALRSCCSFKRGAKKPIDDDFDGLIVENYRPPLPLNDRELRASFRKFFTWKDNVEERELWRSASRLFFLLSCIGSEIVTRLRWLYTMWFPSPAQWHAVGSCLMPRDVVCTETCFLLTGAGRRFVMKIIAWRECRGK